MVVKGVCTGPMSSFHLVTFGYVHVDKDQELRF